MPRRPLSPEDAAWVRLDAVLAVWAMDVARGMATADEAVADMASWATPVAVKHVQTKLDGPDVRLADWPPRQVQVELLAAVRERLTTAPPQ